MKIICEPTSWYSYLQFTDVFKRLSDSDDHESILFQIELWKARGRVPAAIHATYLLLNVILLDKKSQIHNSNIRDLYAISIIRTVNLLLDQEQDSMYAKSMLMMGKEANLPETIVKCRHRCSHGNIPDLDTLRLISRETINYVYRKYWLNQYNLINSRLFDERHYSFLLFSAVLISRSGVDSGYSQKRDYFSLRRSWKTKQKNLPENYSMDDSFRTINLVENKRYLSMGRRLDSLRKKESAQPSRKEVELYNFICKKLLNSCVHEDIFVSVFVELVFANYRPCQSKLFFAILFYTLSQYSFNFTVKLLTQMLNCIFEMSDTFTDLQTFDKNSVLNRVKLYRELSKDFNEVKDVNYWLPENFECLNEEFRSNVNEWLVSLLHYGICLKSKNLSKYHFKYVKLIKVLPTEDYHTMLDYESTALSRLVAAASLLLPLFLIKLPSFTQKQADNDWKSDKTSHLICLYKWVQNPSGKYEFRCLEDHEKTEMLMESRENISEIRSNLNRNLLPGTLWDTNECKVSQTFPLDGTCSLSTHRRILSSFEIIRRGDVVTYMDGSKKGTKVQSQMYKINKSLQSKEANLSIEKKLFKALSYTINQFKSLNGK